MELASELQGPGAGMGSVTVALGLAANRSLVGTDSHSGTIAFPLSTTSITLAVDTGAMAIMGATAVGAGMAVVSGIVADLDTGSVTDWGTDWGTDFTGHGSTVSEVLVTADGVMAATDIPAT